MLHFADKDGETPLHAAVRSGSVAAVHVLLAAGASPGAASWSGASPVWLAAAEGHVEAMQVLVEAGGDVNATDVRGWPPLLASASWGYEAVVRFLVALDGVDLDATVRRGPLSGWNAEQLAEASGAGGLQLAEAIRQQVCFPCLCVAARW
jgi:ankyrin repeat protein